MQATTLERVDVQNVVEALDRAYTGYDVPLSFTVASTANYLRVHDICAEASPIWLKDGRPVALGLLGVRDQRAWVGAFGIAPEYRGKG
ncbi:MAG: GNAT family N-acetyltransferase, partial [Candidatus Eremiobacteraeota bacterium]|nr:GNAT family N-acetyltransferase [Candidatus Eremiobacteraeota bacterium]